MKRLLLSSIFILAFACSGADSTLHLALNSDDATAAAMGQALTSATPEPSAPEGGDAGGLGGVQHINVMVTEVDVHLSGDHDADEVKGEDIDDGSGWHVVTTTPVAIDLMSIRGHLLQSLGDVTLPPGKFNQVRLKLKTDGPTGDSSHGEDHDFIRNAVIDSTGKACDLWVPHSVVDPGLKIKGLYKAQHILAHHDATVVVNLRLHDSERLPDGATCAFRLRPVIDIKTFESHEQGEHHDGDETDGGTHP